jgi:hypothetical protein
MKRLDTHNKSPQCKQKNGKMNGAKSFPINYTINESNGKFN